MFSAEKFNDNLYVFHKKTTKNEIQAQNLTIERIFYRSKKGKVEKKYSELEFKPKMRSLRYRYFKNLEKYKSLIKKTRNHN